MKKFFKKYRKPILISILIFLILILVLILYLFKMWLNINNAADNSYEKTDKKREAPIAINAVSSESKSVLILGMDKKSEGAQRTDAIIVMTFNPKTNQGEFVRIPRDLYVETDNYKGKINALYEKEGLSSLINVLQNYLGVPITNYAKTDFNGLENMVDQVGGVDINSNIVIDNSNNYNLGSKIHVKKGKNHLNGKEALGYSRIRYIDNDIERGNRQGEVIKALIDKILSPQQIVKVDKNAQEFSKYIKTDIKISDAIHLANSINTKPQIKQSKFKWDEAPSNGGDIVYLKPGERKKLSDNLRENLGIKKLNAMTPIVEKP